MLDPFLPEKPEDVDRLKAVQREIHEGFIELVKLSRGPRLKGPETTLFSGEYWTGTKAVALGPYRIRLANCGRPCASGSGRRCPPRSCHPRAAGSAGCSPESQMGELMLGQRNLAEDIVSALEQRAIWARYGL